MKKNIFKKLALNKVTVADLSCTRAGRACWENLGTLYMCTVIKSTDPQTVVTVGGMTCEGYSCYPNSGCLTCGCA